METESNSTEKKSQTISTDVEKRKINVDCQGVYKIYKQGNLEVVALKDVNLQVYAGELIVIMGPSGSGKTTLLNVISGMVRPTAGKVLIKDVDITRLKEEEIQKLLQNGIGFVFQFFNLVPSLTAQGNIELPMIIAKKSDEYRKKRLTELVAAIGMQDRVRHRPFTLSGGQKQRVAIAAAFANNPSIILADEPTGNIDSISTVKIMEIFQHFLIENPDKSIIIATHNPNIRSIADRTLVIKDGHIILEIGKEDTESKIEDSGNEKPEDLRKLYEMGVGIADKVEQTLNPAYRVIEFNEIQNCPTCDSPQIVKKYDQISGTLQIKNNQLVTRGAIYCQKCNQINFITTALFDVKNKLV